jgi:hypothetical protein
LSISRMSRVPVLSSNAIASVKLECTRSSLVSLITGEKDCLDVNQKVRIIKTFNGCDVYFGVNIDNEVILSLTEDECRNMLDHFLSCTMRQDREP